ncbi:serum paraoxonase/arylesterase [Histoplasma capsulatum G186AR]|uniref:Serum paraoxonase/arylesterase n=1 Tax=Ajellomyces capsulatus TaxID=5037 RepID=A0A8H8D7H7_AJECA|nr:serum paraoxonase/arylesterase [Histoplasma capsulatum]QSS70069.1 serum paraoxonase/arylesterase [Histoplasma capsulatum G186AR]
MAISAIGKIAATFAIIIGTISTVFYKPLVTKIHTLHNLPGEWHPFDGGSADIRFSDTIKYSEDIVIDNDRGIAIISFDPGRSEWNTVMGIFRDPNPKGSLYIYDYAATGTIKELVLTGFPDTIDFHPVGINFFRSSPQSKTRLFVANHQRTGTTVAVFDIDYDLYQAKYITTVFDNNETIVSPNSIAPVSYTQFYVTNDHHYLARTRPLLSKIETYFSMPWGWVTFVDFSSTEHLKCEIVATNISFANGIVMTPTGKEVIVASSGHDAVYIYQRDSETNSLSSTHETVHVNFHPDNVNFDHSLDISDPTVFDADGRFLRGLTVGGHPSIIKLVQAVHSPESVKAPSWVAEIRRGAGVDPAPCPAAPQQPKFYARTLYQSNGEHFSTSTTGALDSKRGRLLVASLYGKGILDISWKV